MMLDDAGDASDAGDAVQLGTLLSVLLFLAHTKSVSTRCS